MGLSVAGGPKCSGVPGISSSEYLRDKKKNSYFPLPIASMYGIFTCIWLMFMVNVGKYTIHGCYGLYCLFHSDPYDGLL